MQAILTSALDYKIDKIIHKNKKYETSWVKFGYFFKSNIHKRRKYYIKITIHELWWLEFRKILLIIKISIKKEKLNEIEKNYGGNEYLQEFWYETS